MSYIDEIQLLTKRAIEKGDLKEREAERIYEIGLEHPFLVMAEATRIREHFRGKRITLCMIINAKSGLCPEDCKFCAQSAHHMTGIETYPLLSPEEILKEAKKAKEAGAHCFGIVTSGRSVDGEEEWGSILEAVRKINDMGLKVCASLGFLDRQRAEELKKAGLYRYHHNIETARSFFGQICTTHTFDEKIATIRSAKRAGLSVCSGGIIGMGEDVGVRVKMALTLRELGVDSVPINILNPRPGTPFEGLVALRPMEILLSIALFRFLLPSKDIKLCAGRELHLRQLIPLALVAGCSSLMTGDYLTTKGRDPDLDKEMIEDLNLTWNLS